jgi:phage terminase large subunit
LQLGRPSPKQQIFLRARARVVAYGGARGGGKSWALRTKAILLCLRYPGIRILMIRRSYPEIRDNHILPMRQLTQGAAVYKDGDKSLWWPNKSRIRFGYCDAEADVLQYQGQEYDVILIDEATQLTESQFQALTACVRGVNAFPKRIYLTCNPGGVGHGWVKRLFLDRDYRPGEEARDYLFVPAKIYDNEVLMKSQPGYLKSLQALPEDMRRAWLEGDWDIYSGQYFTEFRRDLHVIEPFAIPSHWKRYAAMDYGLDMLAALWAALSPDGGMVIYREVYESGLIVSAAASRIRPYGSETRGVIAPQDLWGRSADTGKSQAESFCGHGVSLSRVSDRGRVDGWLNLAEWLHPEDGVPPLRIFKSCRHLIRTLPLLQRDEKNPSDCSTEPHEITHAPDALRYLLAGRPAPHRPPPKPPVYHFSAERPRRDPAGRGEAVRVI